MYRLICSLLIMFFTVQMISCTVNKQISSKIETSHETENTDSEFRNSLIGHWKEVRIVGEYKFDQKIHLSADGTFEVSGRIEAMNKFDGICTNLTIDADGGPWGTFTWEEVEMHVPWIGSSGTLNDPYVIRDLIIDAGYDIIGTDR